MRRHRFDAISFTFGLLFLAIAAVLAWSTVDLSLERLRWVGAGFLLAFGAALLLTTGSRSRSSLDRGGRDPEGGQDADSEPGS